MADRIVDILIVEDEPMAAQRLERFVRTSLGDLAGESIFARNLNEGIAAASRLSSSAMIFLDLNLFGADGFDLFEIDIRSPARTIIVSAEYSRAVEAFKHGVVDFVAKPFTQERIAEAVERALKGRDPLASPVEYLGGAPAGTGSGVSFAVLKDIVALHGADDYVEIEVNDGRRLLTRKTMTDLEKMLGADFFRIHRSHIVNKNYVDGFIPLSGSRYQIRLKTGEMLPVGRARADNVKSWLRI